MSLSHSKIVIDLQAIAHNWRAVRDAASGVRCSAVVKADAYGLGSHAVSSALYEAGCRDFFVASLAEAQTLKAQLGAQPLTEPFSIYILSGVFRGEELQCLKEQFIPVIVSFEMLLRWVNVVEGRSGEGSDHIDGGIQARSAIKLDTGMSRLGLPAAELDKLMSEPDLIRRAGVEWVLSHLACADNGEHALNALQLSRFKQIKARLSQVDASLKYCLANSAGCALGAEYHFDMVRPGIALYGSKQQGLLNGKIRPVVSVSLEVMQLRVVPSGESIGYGATVTCERERLLAVAAGGYADGVFRYLSNRACGYVNSAPVSIVGRVSMDSTVFDVTGCKADFDGDVWPQVELLNASHGIDELAQCAGTIGYEVLTSMGERFSREYIGLGDA